MIVARNNYVLVRILKESTEVVDGIRLARYKVGQCYDLPPYLADYLVVRGLASLEMRKQERSRRQRPTDRRKGKHPY